MLPVLNLPLLLCLPLLAPTTALAAPPPQGAVGLDLLLGTRFPLSLGAQAGFEGPWRLQAGLGAGWLPGAYVDAINGVAMAMNAYDQATADVIRSTIQSSLVLDADLGWRPFPGAGFLLGTGYSLITLGGSATAQDIIVAASGLEAPDYSGTMGWVPFDDDSILNYQTSAVLQQLRVELAWRWWLGDRYVLRVGLGAAFTVAARSRIEPAYDPLLPVLVDYFTEEAQDWLDGIMRSYVHSPTITVRLGHGLLARGESG